MYQLKVWKKHKVKTYQYKSPAKVMLPMQVWVDQLVLPMIYHRGHAQSSITFFYHFFFTNARGKQNPLVDMVINVSFLTRAVNRKPIRAEYALGMEEFRKSESPDKLF